MTDQMTKQSIPEAPDTPVNFQIPEFERQLEEMRHQIEEFKYMDSSSGFDIAEEVNRLEKKYEKKIREVFQSLDDWQVVQMARHPARPHAIDYINHCISNFKELHGDRISSDDKALITGIGYLQGTPVAVIGQEKGRSIKDKKRCNFGMTMPGGYRKAVRIMRLAELYNLPILCLVDTPGAYPGVEAEKNCQTHAIAESLATISSLKVPVVSVIIGEGGSGGALALAVADHLMMLQYSIYSVISPEGCASILWKDTANTPQAAKALNLTSTSLKRLNLINEIIEEPLGGAHRDYRKMSDTLSNNLHEAIIKLQQMKPENRTTKRHERLMDIGSFNRL